MRNRGSIWTMRANKNFWTIKKAETHRKNRRVLHSLHTMYLSIRAVFGDGNCYNILRLIRQNISYNVLN
jgi:hypothetical protein